MVPVGNINSFTKGLDKSMDDSSIHELEGERGCLGPPWADIRRQPDLPKDHPLAVLLKTSLRPQGPQKVILVFLCIRVWPESLNYFLNSPPPPQPLPGRPGHQPALREAVQLGCPLWDQQRETDTTSSPRSQGKARVAGPTGSSMHLWVPVLGPAL